MAFDLSWLDDWEVVVSSGSPRNPRTFNLPHLTNTYGPVHANFFECGPSGGSSAPLPAPHGPTPAVPLPASTTAVSPPSVKPPSAEKSRQTPALPPSSDDEDSNDVPEDPCCGLVWFLN